MKRRLGVIVLFAALLGAAPAASAGPVDNTGASQWGCAGVQLLDRVICVSNPLPERLPLPD